MTGETGPSDAGEREEATRRALLLLAEDYIAAKDLVASLEAYMKKRSQKAIYEFRDFFDHVAIIVNPETELDKLQHNYEECLTHLRRAMVESYEYRAEKTLQRVLLYQRLFSLVPFPRSMDPFREASHDKEVQEIRGLLAEIRTNKPRSNVVNVARTAVEKSEDLFKRVTNRKHVLTRAAVALLLILAGVAIAQFVPRLLA